MTLSMRSRRGRILAGSLVVVLAAVYLLGYELRNPPVALVQQALEAAASARRSGAAQLAVEEYRAAEANLRAAQQEIDAANRSWWPFASYRGADSLLTASIRHAANAQQLATGSRRMSRQQLHSDLNRAQQRLDDWQRTADTSLSRAGQRLMLRSVSFELELAREMTERHLEQQARAHLDRARSGLDSLAALQEQYDTAHEQLLQKGRAWAQATVKRSKETRSVAIIVDKSRRELFVLKSGRVIESMPCDLGFNSGHQKMRSGDGATPEGMYQVSQIKKQSQYYRALLLNYPNEEDRSRFSSNLASGRIPAGSKIGGLIEIHGHGGTGKDWTDGCVAVTDSNMNRLMQIATLHTPVAIVRNWER